MEHDQMEYVGFWPRFGASLIDAVLLFLVTAPVLTLIYGSTYWTSDRLILGSWDLLISWIIPFIGCIWFWVAKGQTPGKMAIGAKIVDAETYENISAGQAVVRYLSYFVSAIVLLLGYIWVGFDPKKQAWHDHFARTVVVRKQKADFEPTPLGA